MAPRRSSRAPSGRLGALLLLLTALAITPCALSRAPLATPLTTASRDPLAHSNPEQRDPTGDTDAQTGRGLLSGAPASEAAGVGRHRSLMQRRKGGGHPPGVGKHGPGKGRHPPGVGGHRRRRHASQASQASIAAATAASSDVKVAQERVNWCPPPPSNFSEELVHQIPIQKLIEETPHLTVLPRIGRTCETQPGEFDPASGSQNLCVKGKENGLWRSGPLYQFGVFSADIKCPDQANSSGLVTTFYTTSDFKVGGQDEIDYEFLNRYNSVLQINTWSRGKSVWFKNVMLGFDCAQDYHNYAFLWTPQVLVWYVDYQVVGFFPNTENQGGPSYPTKPSHLVGSFWDGSGFNGNAAAWCGLRDPSTLDTEFVASYRDIKVSQPIGNALCPFNYS